MKRLHLVCNSHIDPAWQWDWNEGLSMAISTFWQAVEFCDEYDYIFCHNEAILYEFIEKVDPALFKEIKRLFNEGKWRIMGGWYLQPDVNATSGEGIVRQIETGRKYFKEKFGYVPTVALNFDSFGHSQGLPQILTKTGHTGYLFCRPQRQEQLFDMREFIWRGPDGSKIKAARAEDDTVYCSFFGTAEKDIKRKASNYEDLDEGIALWGVGNHGGVNSRKDLNDVTRMINESKDVEIIHSYPEKYFESINPTNEYEGPIQPKIIGSYTSMHSIKSLNAELERKLFNTEKMLSVASLGAGYKIDKASLDEVQKALCKIQFHDVLSGTICADSEKTTNEFGRGALATLEKMQMEAYLSMVLKEKKAALDTYPIFVFNYQPYKRKAICEAEVLIPDGFLSDTEERYLVGRQNGKIVASQKIKELGNLNFDRRHRVAFECEMEPLNISRVDFTLEKRPLKLGYALDKDFVYEDETKKVVISKETGLLTSYVVEGKELLNGGAFEPYILDSTENPWGHNLDVTVKNRRPFKLSTCDHGLTRELKQLRVNEDGDLFTTIQSVFEYEDDVVILEYKVYKKEKYVDTKATVFFNDRSRALEFKIPVNYEGKFFGQIAYSTEYFKKDGCDKSTHRFVGLENENGKALTVYNDYVFTTITENNDLHLLALNGTVHCGHLIVDRPIVKERDRYVQYIEEGRREFKFRLSFDDMTTLENNCQEFLNPPYGYNTFPRGDGNLMENQVEVDNKNVCLKAFYTEDDNYILRLINNSNTNQEATINVKGETSKVTFNKYEVKTFIYDGTSLKERTNFIKF